jgi:predicted nucleotidyltransferase
VTRPPHNDEQPLAPPDEVLGEVVRRIVEAARPEKVVLFGSAARGNPSGPDSDLDLLVVKAGAHRRRLAREIYRSLAGVGRAVDVVVVTPEDIERFGTSPALVVEPALREGQVVYDAAAPVAGEAEGGRGARDGREGRA